MRQLLLYICLVCCLPVLAQQPSDVEQHKRLIYFEDKANTPFSLDTPLEFLSPKAVARRQRQNIPLIPRDFPVNPAYVSGLQDAGAVVWYTSRWLNAAVVQCSNEKLQELQALPYVKGSRILNRVSLPQQPQQRTSNPELEVASAANAVPSLEREDYGLAFHQANMLGADELHAAGFTGEGFTIAVFDAGFPGVNTIDAFSHLFENNQLTGTFDFVEKQENVFAANSHGTSVLSTMASFAPGKIIGTAFGANYLLLRTEDAASEHNIEEVNWLLAAEYADSAGADVINSSLGYTTFDAPSTSYTYEDLNGNTAIVTKAADYAAATGMLVVVSAGNDGNKQWRYIGAPADADSVLTVGAVDSLGAKASFSSFGPTADGRIKPDVVALGLRAYVLNPTGNVVQSNGTSFAGPIMAGFATALWQAQSGKSNLQMIQLLRQIGSNAEASNNSIGYGIPNFSRTVTASSPDLLAEEKVFVTNPVKREPIVLTLGQEWLLQKVEVQVLDATGKQVYSQLISQAKPEQVLSLQPHTLQKGLYLCRILAGNRVTTLRIVKL